MLVWLITGCSSGLGKALALEVLARGDRVIATCRKPKSRIQDLEDAGAAIMELDVTASEEELQREIEQAIKIYDKIDVLVPNAGYGEVGYLEDVRCVSTYSSSIFLLLDTHSD